jgi:hypothetical protein
MRRINLLKYFRGLIMNEILLAFERGIDNGFFRGDVTCETSDWSAEQLVAYKRGYNHGVWLYCENQKESYVREGVCDE